MAKKSASGPRIPAKVLKLLREARAAATLEKASFAWNDSHLTVKCRSGDFDGHPDTFIKERVQLHHSTWIIHPLDRVIAWAEGGPEPRL